MWLRATRSVPSLGLTAAARSSSAGGMRRPAMLPQPMMAACAAPYSTLAGVRLGISQASRHFSTWSEASRRDRLSELHDRRDAELPKRNLGR